MLPIASVTQNPAWLALERFDMSLVLNRAEEAWKVVPREWIMAKAQFAVIFGARFTRTMVA